MYICDFSRSVGAGRATTRNTRGLTRSAMALIVPPLPAVSRPSNTTQTLAPDAFTHSCMATSSPCRRRNSFSYSFSFIFDASGEGPLLAVADEDVPFELTSLEEPSRLADFLDFVSFLGICFPPRRAPAQ